MARLRLWEPRHVLLSIMICSRRRMSLPTFSTAYAFHSCLILYRHFSSFGYRLRLANQRSQLATLISRAWRKDSHPSMLHEEYSTPLVSGCMWMKWCFVGGWMCGMKWGWVGCMPTLRTLMPRCDTKMVNAISTYLMAKRQSLQERAHSLPKDHQCD